jgi:hypothetical protein
MWTEWGADVKTTKPKKRKATRRGARDPRQMSIFDLLEPEEKLPTVVKPRRPKRPPPAAALRPAVLTPAEAAAYLNIKASTLKSWRAKGVGPVFVKRAARLIGYTPAALDAYLAQTAPGKA